MVSKIDIDYKDILTRILKEGYDYEDPKRKGVIRKEILEYSLKYNFKDGFPILSTKEIHWKSVIYELLWFLKGDTNIKYLVDRGVNIWNKDAYNWYLKNKSNHHSFDYETWLNYLKQNNYNLGNLGRVYGAQWRDWTVHRVGPNDSYPIYVDQIFNLINNLKEQPLATDHIVTAWNPGELDDMALPPCHRSFQVLVRPLSPLEILEHSDKTKVPYKGPKYGFILQWDQRSVDTFLGLPFNIASYATLAIILEKITEYKALGIKANLSKVHIYHDHLKQVKEQINRNCNIPDKVELEFNQPKSLWNGDINTIINTLYNGDHKDFKLKNYKPQPRIAAKMLERNE